MQIGKPLREYTVEPLELPEPLRESPSIEPSAVPVEEPAFVPDSRHVAI